MLRSVLQVARGWVQRGFLNVALITYWSSGGARCTRILCFPWACRWVSLPWCFGSLGLETSWLEGWPIYCHCWFLDPQDASYLPLLCHVSSPKEISLEGIDKHPEETAALNENHGGRESE